MNRAQEVIEIMEQFKTSPRYPNYKIKQDSPTEFSLYHDSGIFLISVQEHPSNKKWWGEVLTKGKGQHSGYWDPVQSPALKKRFSKYTYDIPALAREVDQVAKYLQSEQSQYGKGRPY